MSVSLVESYTDDRSTPKRTQLPPPMPSPAHIPVLVLVLALSLGAAPTIAAPQDDFDSFEETFDPEVFEFDDAPRERDLPHPDWFKVSFLDLGADLEEAITAGKSGLMVYFGQKHCAYCEALLEVNFGKPDIVKYTQENFDVVAIDIWGDREVTDMYGETLSEKEFAERQNTNFTPSIIFYDRDGQEALLLRGYYPPYQFRAALEYVADRHHERQSFRDYLARAEPTMSFEPGGLNEEDFFPAPPYALDRRYFPAEHPLAVFFEQGECHACDVLHTGPLGDPAIRRLLEGFDLVQLDMWSDTPVLTPAGERLTAKSWAAKLGLFYAPSILFFDEHGEEIIRVDSVVRFTRLRAVLAYILTDGYEKERSFQRWRERYGDAAMAAVR
jgi:thioredoxin-related protein